MSQAEVKDSNVFTQDEMNRMADLADRILNTIRDYFDGVIDAPRDTSVAVAALSYGLSSFLVAAKLGAIHQPPEHYESQRKLVHSYIDRFVEFRFNQLLLAAVPPKGNA